jgi:hypothetical protein
MIIHFKIDQFWDDEYKHLNYVNEPFNDVMSLKKWTAMGYTNKFTGDMCDMRQQQPSWNQKFIDIFSDMGWKNIGTSYYRIMPGTILPTHNDLYVKYIDLFGLCGKEKNIRRAVIFLEDWQPGHYAEYLDIPFTQYKSGATVIWEYDAPHMAANVGATPRYTLQITGHV